MANEPSSPDLFLEISSTLNIRAERDRIIREESTTIIIQANSEATVRIADAKAWAAENLIGNKLLVNDATGLEMYVSGGSIDKMLAGNKSHPQVRAAAIYSIPELVKRAVRTAQRRDDGRDPQIEWIHEFHASFSFQGRVYRLRLLVKEFRPQTGLGVKLHSYRVEE